MKPPYAGSGNTSPLHRHCCSDSSHGDHDEYNCSGFVCREIFVYPCNRHDERIESRETLISPNVVDCPKCKAVLGQEDAKFEPLGNSMFRITCSKCGQGSDVHHAAFRRRQRTGDGPMELRNPFVPLHIPVPRD